MHALYLFRIQPSRGNGTAPQPATSLRDSVCQLGCKLAFDSTVNVDWPVTWLAIELCIIKVNTRRASGKLMLN